MEEFASVEEFLAAEGLPEAAAAQDALAYRIDGMMRVVKVPEGASVLGVEGDKDVNRVVFRAPRMYRGEDLSLFDAQVNYANAGGELGVYPAGKPVADGDEVEVSWLVGEPAVRYKGDVSFSVRFFVSDGRGQVSKSYSTAVATARCLDGLDVDKALPEDRLASLVEQLSGLTEAAAAKADAAAAKADAAAADVERRADAGEFDGAPGKDGVTARPGAGVSVDASGAVSLDLDGLRGLLRSSGSRAGEPVAGACEGAVRYSYTPLTLTVTPKDPLKVSRPAGAQGDYVRFMRMPTGQAQAVPTVRREACVVRDRGGRARFVSLSVDADGTAWLEAYLPEGQAGFEADVADAPCFTAVLVGGGAL